MASAGEEHKKRQMKIIVIGDQGVGKTSIIKRYTQRYFSDHYKATVGVDFFVKDISWDANTRVQLQFWDLQGQDRIRNLTRAYYRGSHGCLIVFDVTNPSTLDAATTWKRDFDSKTASDDRHRTVPVILLANKCDLEKQGLAGDSLEMEQHCKDRGYLEWFEVSAKENYNIDEAGRFLVEAILTSSTLERPRKQTSTVDLDKELERKKDCC